MFRDNGEENRIRCASFGCSPDLTMDGFDAGSRKQRRRAAAALPTDGLHPDPGSAARLPVRGGWNELERHGASSEKGNGRTMPCRKGQPRAKESEERRRKRERGGCVLPSDDVSFNGPRSAGSGTPGHFGQGLQFM